MHPTAIQKAFFGALLFIVTLAFLWLIRGFLQPIFWAVALAIVIYPVHRRLDQRFRHRASLAALLSMLLIVLIVLLPLAGVIAAITNEAAALYQRLQADNFQINSLYAEAQRHLPQLISALNALGINVEKLQSEISAAAVGTSSFVASRVLEFGQNTLRVTAYFFIMLYLLFFFLRDGTRLLDGLVRALPLGDARERQLLERFAEVSRATMKGTLVIGLVQGTLGGVAFWLLGIAAPVLWGAVMALMSILPAIGPAVIWLPAAVVLFVEGRIAAGLILIAVGIFVIGLVDNLLRPVLVGRDTRMPDYLVLLSTLGGLAAFGLAGIVIGPIIAAFFLSCWHMANEEFGEDGADFGSMAGMESTPVIESTAPVPPSDEAGSHGQLPETRRSPARAAE
ncbi:MAG TPA: AI-2E family transporter [Gammaproteobacteria bacterium]|nr:AI-2E family transporter [Gammaproteobacteria bacterium]